MTETIERSAPVLRKPGDAFVMGAVDPCGICGVRYGWAYGEPCLPCARRVDLVPLPQNAGKWRSLLLRERRAA